MGCDIHAVLEAPEKYADGWVSLGELDIDRDYVVFANLAGVRLTCVDGKVEPIGVDRLADASFDPNDYEDPSDAPLSRHAMCVFEDLSTDGHSHGFALLSEMRGREALEELLARCTAIAVAHGKDPEKCRLTFCFDN